MTYINEHGIECFTKREMAAREPELLDYNVARPCPFCGAQATIQHWHGGPPTARLVSCSSETCKAAPSIWGRTRPVALRLWNKRWPS